MTPQKAENLLDNLMIAELKEFFDENGISEVMDGEKHSSLYKCAIKAIQLAAERGNEIWRDFIQEKINQLYDKFNSELKTEEDAIMGNGENARFSYMLLSNVYKDEIKILNEILDAITKQTTKQ